MKTHKSVYRKQLAVWTRIKLPGYLDIYQETGSQKVMIKNTVEP